MSEAKWIKIVTEIFDDEKMLLIEMLPEADAIIVIWFKLLCLAGKQNNSGVFMLTEKIPYNVQMFSTIFRRKESIVQLAFNTFEQFGMIEIINDVVTIPKWGKHQSLDQLENKKEYMREYMKGYRQKQLEKTECKTNSKTNSKTNVNQADKKRIEKNREETDNTKKLDINTFFESVWGLYPEKRGKGQVSDTQKAKLYKIGYDVLARCIERYKESKPEWQKWQNGSTFFNSGYIDFLEEEVKQAEINDKYEKAIQNINWGEFADVQSSTAKQ